jgi:hypothetical protein
MTYNNLQGKNGTALLPFGFLAVQKHAELKISISRADLQRRLAPVTGAAWVWGSG